MFIIKVLVIDDSPAITKLIKNTLYAEGTETIECNDPLDAASFYTKNMPDLVIIDNNMRVFNGLDILKQIVRINKNAKILVTVASLNWPIIERYLNAGAIGYLLKPFTKIELIDTVHDPWGKYERKPVMIFSMAANRIQDALQKIFQMDVSVTIKQINLLMAKKKDLQISSRSGSLQEIKVTTHLEDIVKSRPLDSLCYSMEFSGQLHGYVTFTANKDQCKTLISYGKGYFDEMKDDKAHGEFFYIIISRLLATITNLTGFIIQEEFVSELDPSILQTGIRKGGVLSAICEINTPKFEIPIELEIWTNIDNLLTKIGRRFI